MSPIASVALAVVVLLVAFIAWRWTSVRRGARRRDDALLDRIEPLGRRLDAGETVSPGEFAALAARPEIRYVLFEVLRQMNRADLLPTNYSSSVQEGESALAYWLMHPNELQGAPEEIQLVETVRTTVDGLGADFHVYRYRMPQGHWAAKDGWLLGLAGPMRSGSEPYAEMPGAFSRAGDADGKVTPAELVDWYVGMLKAKGLAA
jgi:hypothetical protein